MSETPLPGFFTRFFLAWAAYFRTLFDAQFAAGVIRLREGKPALPEETPKNKKSAKSGSEGSESAPESDPSASQGAKKDKKPEKKEVILRQAGPEAALQLLSLLQREGRFVDFLEQDVTTFSDEDIGAAARVVHDGCKKALSGHVAFAPVRAEDEESKVVVPEGYAPSEVKLTGNVSGAPPFTGTLRHKGWRVTECKLPEPIAGRDPRVVAPAEVEL